MNAFVPYLAALHMQELREEARQHRRAKLNRQSQPSVPAWRRRLGGALASAARSLDPNIGAERASRRATDAGVGRALAS
ncbi:MAG TPA: hypothetical protein VMQ65_05200 [Candidatus Limnocylindria bacterium]|nr:hypothetical protein [Candidatus Limnocylindria bacterium]